MSQTPVSKIMTSAALVTAQRSATVEQVTRLLLDNPIHHVLVLDGNRLAGVVTARDLLRCSSDRGAAVSDAMQSDVQVISRDDSIREAASLLTDHDVHFLPVVDGDELVGVVSTTDLIRHLIER